MDGYYHDMDSLFAHKDGDRGFWNAQYDSVLNLYSKGMHADAGHRLYDGQHLKSDFLIASSIVHLTCGGVTGTNNTTSTCS